jgi:GH43 family beta-xylosidase
MMVNLKSFSVVTIALFTVSSLLVSCSVLKRTVTTQPAFTNPLLPHGADPWNTYKDGYYYYTQTMGDRIEIWKTNDLARLNTAPHKAVWVPPVGTAYSKQLWAPEVHFIDSSWYVYFAADNGSNINHRLYVIENKSEDPLEGEWIFKGKISDSTDRWAIDGSVF